MSAEFDEQSHANKTAVTPSQESAEAILERAAQGDPQALLELYDRFSSVLMGVALRITGTRAEAEDVVQDAMMRAWRESDTFDRRRGSAIAWLVTLTRNRAIDVVRSRKRRDEQPELSTETPAPAEASPELEVSIAERAAAVRLALDTLSTDQRTVLELAYYSGLSHSEIATQLNQPLGTVKTRIAQAVRLLREGLARFAPTPLGDS